MAHKKRRIESWREFLALWEEHRQTEELALGLLIALRNSKAFDWKDTNGYYGVSKFLVGVLEDKYPELGEQIYREATDFFLKIAEEVRFKFWTDTSQRFATFLGKNPPIDGLRGRIKEYLLSMVKVYVYELSHPAGEGPSIRAAIFRALLRYQMYDVLEDLVKRRVYEAIPVLYTAIEEQVGRNIGKNPQAVRGFVKGSGLFGGSVRRALLLALDDHRPLKLLLALAGAYRDRYRLEYPIHEHLVELQTS